MSAPVFSQPSLPLDDPAGVVCPSEELAALIDEAGQPTIAARDEILDFFALRLKD